MTEQVNTLTADKEALTGEVEALKGASGEERGIDKSALPESVRKHLDDLSSRLEKREKDIEKMQEESLTITMVSKAAEVAHVGPVASISDLLKKVKKQCPDVFDSLFEVLKTANARISKGDLTREQGSDSDDGSDAVARIEAAADEYRKANPNISKEQAFSHIFKTSGDLRAAYMAEQQK